MAARGSFECELSLDKCVAATWSPRPVCHCGCGDFWNRHRARSIPGLEGYHGKFRCRAMLAGAAPVFQPRTISALSRF